MIKIDLNTGIFEKVYNRSNEVYNQILFIPQHNQYYLFGFERMKFSNRYFVRILNEHLIEIGEKAIEEFSSDVEYSPKEDLFYIRFLHDHTVKALKCDFSTVVKEFTTKTVTTIIKGNHSQREVIDSIHGYITGFSLSEDLLLSISYAHAVVVFDKDGKEIRTFPMLLGSARFMGNGNELIVKGNIYKISTKN